MRRYSGWMRLTMICGALLVLTSAVLLGVMNLHKDKLQRRIPGVPAVLARESLGPIRQPPRSPSSALVVLSQIFAPVTVLGAVSVIAGWWLAGRLLDRQRRFIANAAHELRAPLAIQRAAIQIGLDQPSPERLARIREELLEVNRRNERLIHGLLELAQGDHGLDAIEPVALDALVRQAVHEISAAGLANKILIRQSTEPGTVNGDPVLLHSLVANLLDNAVRYNRPNGVVDVHVTADAVLTVCNTGPAIPEDRIHRMFEPFRRFHTARTGSTQSAGLGLSIVASIARAHGARIIARPNPGGGLQLTVRFKSS